MKEGTKILGMSVGVFVGLIVLVFVLGFVGLQYEKIFAPAHEDVKRQVFENTQSYIHGKIQDLAKYKREYEGADDLLEKNAIQSIIVQQFAQFDSKKVVDDNLRNFLIKMRGF